MQRIDAVAQRRGAAPRARAGRVRRRAPAACSRSSAWRGSPRGEASVADVLALGSRLLADVVPGATGAWYAPDPARDRLTVADAFGPASSSLRGLTIRRTK